MTELLSIDGNEFQGIRVPTEKASLLMIRGDKGFLGCGYFNIEVADKLGECVALVTGVNSFDSMYDAEVFKVSEKAAEAGITKGMTGKEALKLIAERR